MLNLEELKEDRMKLMVIVDKIYSDHCSKIGDCGCPGNLAYVNATHAIYNTHEYDIDLINHYLWLEEKVIVSILISVNKLIKAGKLDPVDLSNPYSNPKLHEFISTVINIVSVQNYKDVMLVL